MKKMVGCIKCKQWKEEGSIHVYRGKATRYQNGKIVGWLWK